MRVALVIILIFLMLGLVSLAISLVNKASFSIIAIELGYLILVGSVGYILWKKYRHA